MAHLKLCGEDSPNECLEFSSITLVINVYVGVVVAEG